MPKYYQQYFCFYSLAKQLVTCDLGSSDLELSVLKGEIAFIQQLQKWLGEKCNWKLCYGDSQDKRCYLYQISLPEKSNSS